MQIRLVGVCTVLAEATFDALADGRLHVHDVFLSRGVYACVVSITYRLV